MLYKWLFINVIVYCAVRCEEKNYYVVQMPDESPGDLLKSTRFKVYWNVPTIQCRSKKIPFLNLYEDYGIIQNRNDSFRGDKISILYDPGIFPALLKNESSGQFVFRNGGVPQEGSLEKHLQAFRKVLDESVPDQNFNGVGIIDFESWRPIYRQNFGVLTPYKDISYEIERKRHWWWSKQWVTAEATRRFEEAATKFVHSTLKLAKEMRPSAKWAYYAYPYCFNVGSHHMTEDCASHVPHENDKIHWLWTESTALYPSLYSSKDMSSDQLRKMIRGRVKEARRLVKNNAPILPYFWFKYRDGEFMNEKDLKVALDTMYRLNASGLIIWGSSNDVNTKSKCLALRDYVTKVLGPNIAKYTKNNNKIIENIFEIEENTNNAAENINLNITKVIPEEDIDWLPIESYNYTKYVVTNITNGLNSTDKVEIDNESTNDNTTVDQLKENSLIDVIVNFLFKESDDLDDDSTEASIITINSTNYLSKNKKKGVLHSITPQINTTENNNTLNTSKNKKKGSVFKYLNTTSNVSNNSESDFQTSDHQTDNTNEYKSKSNSLQNNFSSTESANNLSVLDKINLVSSETIMEENVYLNQSQVLKLNHTEVESENEVRNKNENDFHKESHFIITNKHTNVVNEVLTNDTASENASATLIQNDNNIEIVKIYENTIKNTDTKPLENKNSKKGFVNNLAKEPEPRETNLLLTTDIVPSKYLLSISHKETERNINISNSAFTEAIEATTEIKINTTDIELDKQHEYFNKSKINLINNELTVSNSDVNDFTRTQKTQLDDLDKENPQDKKQVFYTGKSTTTLPLLLNKLNATEEPVHDSYTKNDANENRKQSTVSQKSIIDLLNTSTLFYDKISATNSPDDVYTVNTEKLIVSTISTSSKDIKTTYNYIDESYTEQPIALNDSGLFVNALNITAEETTNKIVIFHNSYYQNINETTSKNRRKGFPNLTVNKTIETFSINNEPDITNTTLSIGSETKIQPQLNVSNSKNKKKGLSNVVRIFIGSEFNQDNDIGETTTQSSELGENFITSDSEILSEFTNSTSSTDKVPGSSATKSVDYISTNFLVCISLYFFAETLLVLSNCV